MPNANKKSNTDGQGVRGMPTAAPDTGAGQDAVGIPFKFDTSRPFHMGYLYGRTYKRGSKIPYTRPDLKTTFLYVGGDHR